MKRVELPMAHIGRLDDIPKIAELSWMTTHYFIDAIPMQTEPHLLKSARLFVNGFDKHPTYVSFFSKTQVKEL